MDAMRLSNMLTGRSTDAERMFRLFDTDNDQLLSLAELHDGLLRWRLNLSREMFAQLLECNLMYADKDGDGALSLSEFTQLFKLMSEVRGLGD